MSRLFKTALVAVLSVWAALTLSIPASAEEPPSPVPSSTTAHPDGQPCNIVPNQGTFFDFREACRRHDNCYEFVVYVHGYLKESARKECDSQFYTDMREWCSANWSNFPRGYEQCHSTATAYYWGVRVCGDNQGDICPSSLQAQRLRKQQALPAVPESSQPPR